MRNGSRKPCPTFNFGRFINLLLPLPLSLPTSGEGKVGGSSFNYNKLSLCLGVVICFHDKDV
jgi:hypothetical protein